jgi:hypothetical protein
MPARPHYCKRLAASLTALARHMLRGEEAVACDPGFKFVPAPSNEGIDRLVRVCLAVLIMLFDVLC